MPDDVTPADSLPATDAPPAPAPVAAAPAERPVENLKGEFDRKFSKMQQQMDTLMQYIASQAPRPPQAAPTNGATEPTDDDLWALAQQGDRHAFTALQQRTAQQVYRHQNTVNARAQMIQAQLHALMAKYPVLADQSHPLTQAANTAYQYLVQAGYPANTPETALEAAKTAIADRPDLIAELHAAGSIAREGVRQTVTTRAQSGVTPPSVRQTPPTPAGPKLREGDLALATRMGIKDPSGAKARFLQRQQEGQSSFGAVGQNVREEDL